MSQNTCQHQFTSWVQMCIVEGKSYGEAEPGDITEAFLDANTLLMDAKGKPVLAPGKASEQTADHRIVARFRGGKVGRRGLTRRVSLGLESGLVPRFPSCNMPGVALSRGGVGEKRVHGSLWGKGVEGVRYNAAPKAKGRE